MGMLSAWHILLIMVFALLLFGKRLPEVGRSLGRGISEFKKGLRDVQDELMEEKPAEKRIASPKDVEEQPRRLSDANSKPAEHTD